MAASLRLKLPGLWRTARLTICNMPVNADRYMAGDCPSLSRGGGWLPPTRAAVSPLQYEMQLTDFDTASAWRNGAVYPEYAVNRNHYLPDRHRSLSMSSHAPTSPRSRHTSHASHLDAQAAGSTTRRDEAMAPRRPTLERRGFSQPIIHSQRTELHCRPYRPQAKPLTVCTSSHQTGSRISLGPVSAPARPTGYISPTEPTHWADVLAVPCPSPSVISSQAASSSTKLPALPYGMPRSRSAVPAQALGPRWIQARPPLVSIDPDGRGGMSQWRSAGGSWR